MDNRQNKGLQDRFWPKNRGLAGPILKLIVPLQCIRNGLAGLKFIAIESFIYSILKTVKSVIFCECTIQNLLNPLHRSIKFKSLQSNRAGKTKTRQLR